MADEKEKFAPREVAVRIFAAELRDIEFELDRPDEKSPHKFVLPTGGIANRIFMVGSLSEVDDIGTDNPYYRGRIVDPTGSILIYAGEYQPEAADALSKLNPPSYVAVTGKISLYTTEDGKVIASVRAETISEVDKATKDRWTLETARLTVKRLKTADPQSRELYGKDISKYAEMARTAILEFSIGPAPEENKNDDEDGETFDL